MTRTRLSQLVPLLWVLGVPAGVQPDVPEGSSLTFVAKTLLLDAHGTFRAWQISDARVDLDDLASSYVKVEVDLASVDTGIEARDEHLRAADFLDVETYPKAIARAHSASRLGSDELGRDLYEAQFTLDLHGVQKTSTATFSVLSPSPLEVEGALILHRRDFGIGGPYSRWNPMSVAEEISVRFRARVSAEP